jgi:hypothetical protein
MLSYRSNPKRLVGVVIKVTGIDPGDCSCGVAARNNLIDKACSRLPRDFIDMDFLSMSESGALVSAPAGGK